MIKQENNSKNSENNLTILNKGCSPIAYNTPLYRVESSLKNKIIGIRRRTNSYNFKLELSIFNNDNKSKFIQELTI